MENTIDAKKLRTVAGAFATGVTVVTTTREDGSIHGMTANSFLSVSLSPPLVAFSVREQGSLMAHLEVGKAVGISILSEEQEAISNRFAGREMPPMDIPFEQHPNGASTIRGSLAWYSTEVQQLIPAGDHILVLCLVADLDRPAGVSSPLLYYSGYKSLAG
ncbi:MAG: flavin reductase family protein [Bacteroidota bacterium]